MANEPITIRWTRRDGVTVETTTDFDTRVGAALREWTESEAEGLMQYGTDEVFMRAVLEAALLATDAEGEKVSMERRRS